MNKYPIGIDYRAWDWLPQAAAEIEAYLERLLEESAIRAHDVTARAKSIASFDRKCEVKNYKNPKTETTDTVAVRIITYSVTDRERATELIRGRFTASEDRNPGAEKQDTRRGYDCHHFVVTGESPEAEPGWMIARGKLSKYFKTFGGLEIQIRTVAAHAWAEFEHSRRYKGLYYDAIGDRDRETIDLLFGAAADARRALDEAFIVIDRVLANPSTAESDTSNSGLELDGDTLATHPESESPAEDTQASERVIDPTTLSQFLGTKYPGDEEATEKGVQFACDLVTASGIHSIESLENALDLIDSERVRQLMDTATSVTRVRRLDDDLLARFAEDYIQNTGSIGNVKTRPQQLKWRFDRLRDKVPLVKYKIYRLVGSDCPIHIRGKSMPAAQAVRELARVLADIDGARAARIPNVVEDEPNALLPSTRSKEVKLSNGDSLWVATNLNRENSETTLVRLLEKTGDLDLRVEKNSVDLQQPHQNTQVLDVEPSISSKNT